MGVQSTVTDNEALRGIVGEICQLGLEKSRDVTGLGGSVVFILRYLKSHQEKGGVDFIGAVSYGRTGSTWK